MSAMLDLEETATAARPSAADGVDRWFEPLLAERLSQAGFGTLGALAARIDEAGPRWWYPVRGMGVTRAGRVADWVRAHRQGNAGEVCRAYAAPPR